MKCIVPITTEVDFTILELAVPVNYGTEDISEDFPGRRGDMLYMSIDIDKGVVFDWPQGQTANLYMKVVDGGCYTVRGLAENGEPVNLTLENEYVPYSLGRGGYGDYLVLKVNGGGKIENWQFDINEFLREED